MMKKLKKINAEMALDYLEKLREYIKDEVYEETRKNLKEED